MGVTRSTLAGPCRLQASRAKAEKLACQPGREWLWRVRRWRGGISGGQAGRLGSVRGKKQRTDERRRLPTYRRPYRSKLAPRMTLQKTDSGCNGTAPSGQWLSVDESAGNVYSYPPPPPPPSTLVSFCSLWDVQWSETRHSQTVQPCCCKAVVICLPSGVWSTQKRPLQTRSTLAWLNLDAQKHRITSPLQGSLPYFPVRHSSLWSRVKFPFQRR